MSTILHLITTTNVGGAELMMERLVRSSSNNRHIVVSIMCLGEIGYKLQQSDVVVHSLGLKNWYHVFMLVVNFVKLVRRYRPDLIQSWLYHADFLACFTLLFYRAPIIWNIRQTKFSSSSSFSSKLIMKMCALLSHYVPATIICAAETSARSHVQYGYDESKMKVIHNGFFEKPADFERVRAIRQQFSLRSEDLVVGIVGRFHFDKDHKTFIKAASVIAKNISNVRFLMVGSKLDWENQILKTWIEESHIGDKVVLVGSQKDVENWYSVMDVFMLTSISEGFPNVLAEAMLSGVPSFSTKCGDASSIVLNPHFLTEISDHSEIAQKIICFFHMNIEQRRELGRKSKEKIKQDFSMDKCISLYSQVYSSI